MSKWSFKQLCQRWQSCSKVGGVQYARCADCGGEDLPPELTITEEIMSTKKAPEKAVTQEQEATASAVLVELAGILNLGPDGDVLEATRALKDKADLLIDHANEMVADLHHVARALNLEDGATRDDMDAAIAQLRAAQNNLQDSLDRQRIRYNQDTEVLRERLNTYRTAMGELESILGVGLGEDVRAAAQRVKDAADHPRLQGDEAVLADFGRRILRGEVSLCIHTR